jgi:hypothetical protein
MAGTLQRARTLAIIGSGGEARTLFEELCQNIGVVEDPPDSAPIDVEDDEHQARLREFEAQQAFSWTSCAAAENLQYGKSFYGQVPNEVSGTMSWTHMKEKVNEKFEVLKSMDDEIANVLQLSVTLAATERIEEFTKDGLSALAGDLKDYIGESVDGLAQIIDKQTEEMRQIARKNEDKLDRAAQLQRRILVQSMQNGEDLQELDAKVDHIQEDVDLLQEGVDILDARVDFLTQYTQESREILTTQLDVIEATTKELSITQRETLEQVYQNSNALRQLDATTQNVLSSVLSNGKQLQDLSSGQRVLLNTVLESRKIVTRQLDVIEATTKELSTTQRLTLVQVRRNSASLNSLSADTQNVLTAVLNNEKQLSDLTSGQRLLLNDAMSKSYTSGSATQNQKSTEARALSAYSMAWDNNGDGKMSSQEQVSLAMDMSMSPTSSVGKVMAAFKSQSSISTSSVRATVVKYFGSSAGSTFDKLTSRLSSVTASDVMGVLKSARKVSSTITKAWDAINNVRGKSWTQVAKSTFSMASQLFGRGDKSSLSQSAAAVARTFNTVLSVASKAKSLASAAASVSGLGSCVKPVLGAVRGFSTGGWVGTGISLVKSAVTGGLGKCANAVIDVGKKIYAVVKKVAPVVYKAAKKVVSTVYRGAKAVVSTVYRGVKAAVSTGYKAVKSVAKTVWNGVKSAGRKVASWFGFRRRRDAHASSDNSTSNGTSTLYDEMDFEFDFEEDADAILNVDELFADADALSGAAVNFHDAADGLYFNTSKGIDLDVGPLSHPDIEAKYSSESSLFSESLQTVQAYAHKQAEIEAQFRVDAFLTDNVGRCLLDGDCDLLDRVNRYDMALQLMRTKRSAVVFSILEEFVEMHGALLGRNWF